MHGMEGQSLCVKNGRQVGEEGSKWGGAHLGKQNFFEGGLSSAAPCVGEGERTIAGKNKGENHCNLRSTRISLAGSVTPTERDFLKFTSGWVSCVHPSRVAFELGAAEAALDFSCSPICHKPRDRPTKETRMSANVRFWNDLIPKLTKENPQDWGRDSRTMHEKLVVWLSLV